MNYCPRCKLRMPAEATVCKECGGGLRTVGAGSPAGEAGAAAAGEGDLALKLQGLRHEVRRSRAFVVAMGSLAALLGMALLVLLVGLHFFRVFQYAEVAQIEISLNENAHNAAVIRFVRQNEGKIEFLREAAGRSETVIDHGDSVLISGQPQEFTWSGDETGDYTIRVRFRRGWSTEERTWIASGGKMEPRP